MGKSIREKMQDVYSAEWRLDSEDVSHIHAGYWYEDTAVQDIHTAYENYMKEITKHLSVQPEDVILDVGCGNGAAAIWMAEHYGCRVRGIDIVPLHVEVAQKAVQKRGLEDLVEIHCMNVLEMDFADATFDYAYSLECLHHLDERQGAFQKIQKCLKSNGRFALAELALHKKCSWLSQKLAGLITGSEVMGYIEEYDAMLTNSGFDLFQLEDVTDFTLKQMYRWSKSENHRQIIDYSKKIYGQTAAFTIPLCFFLSARAEEKSHWGLHFIWADKHHK